MSDTTAKENEVLGGGNENVGTYYSWPSISHSHWNHWVFGKLFPMFDHIAKTLVVRDGTRLALATYYDTLYVSILFDMRESGGFPTFHSVLSFSVFMVFGRLCFYKRQYCPRFFSINQSFRFIHSYHLLPVHSLDTSLSVSITCTVAHPWK